MKKIFFFGLLFCSTIYGQSQAPDELLRQINQHARRGTFDNLSDVETRDVLKSFRRVLSILRGEPNPDQEVMCVPTDMSDFGIIRVKDGVQIGRDQRGNNWCAAALSTARGGVVCAPESLNDFAFYRISDGNIIGRDASGYHWCTPGKVNARAGIVCAPESLNDFAIYRISDGQQIGRDSSGHTWCDAVIESANNGIVCAPESLSNFAMYRISDGKQMSAGRRGHQWCLTQLMNL